jgi:hypothetical protein
MRRVYVVDRKILGIVCLALVLAVAGYVTWTVKGADINKAAFSQRNTPEISIASIATEPKTVMKDLSYEGIPFPASQLFKGKEFTAVVGFKNNSEKTLKDVPVEVVLSVDGKTPVKKTSLIKEIAPGAVVTLNFPKFPVLGDAKGKEMKAGLHQLEIRTLANPVGGVELSNERAMIFFVDSKVK